MPSKYIKRGGIMRGYQKKVVYLKNIGSSLFEEAYFVIKSDSSDEALKNSESLNLVKEANRIIEENTNFHYKNKKSKISLNSILIFGAGFLTAALISLLFILI